MAVVIQDGSASFRDKAMGWAGCPIDTTGLELAHFFGGSLDSSLRNFSYGKADSVAVGAPTPRTNSVALQGRVNYLQTGMADASEVTLVVAFKPVEAVDAIVAGNLVSTTGGTGRKLAIAYGSQMLVSGFRGTESNASGPLLPTALTVGTPVCLALRNTIGSAAEITLSNLTSGEVAKLLNPGTPSLGSPIRVGSAYIPTGYSGKTEVYAVLGFSRRISDTELAKLYAWLKSYCARRSITI